jgi:hypothetical protein
MTGRMSIVLGLLLTLPAQSLAQTVLTFDRLADRLNAGDRVRIVDTAGREHTGAVAALGGDVIALARGGGATERFARADVREVWMRRHDPVKNGALIGFAAVGVSYCALAVSWDNAQQCGVPAIFLGGLGAGLGALVDAAISRQGVVFRAEAPVTWHLRPVSGGGVAGGAVLRW